MRRYVLGTHAALALAAAALLMSSASCGREGGEPQPTPEATPVSPETTATAPSTHGIFDDHIIFGQSAAFSGPAQALGNGMRAGILAAFKEVNDAGGVHGRQVELVSFDDGYEPEAAATNTVRLIEQENVFALIGEVGTPTSRSATPVAAEAGVPFIAPFTGAEFLRNDSWDNILNLRASYYQETEEMVARLTQDLAIERIAVMYQDDSYGRAGYRGATLALERRGMQPVSIGLYPRNTTAVKTALLDLERGNPEAIIMIGAYRPVAALIAWARHKGLDPIFMTVSFVGSNALARELGPAGAGVFVTQVVPFPTDDSLPVVAAYLAALEAYAPGRVPGFVSLEGYLAGRLAIAGLERCGRDVDRACFLDGIYGAGEMDIDGFRLRYDGPDDNQGSDAVFLTVIGPDGNYQPMERMRMEDDR